MRNTTTTTKATDTDRGGSRGTTASREANFAVSDEQLLLEYRRTGNRDLFTELVRRYERELFSYLRRYLGSTEMAEDAFQSTFLQVHLKCEQFEHDRKVRPWLYTIATNQAIDASRRNKRHRSVSLDRAGVDGEELGKLSDLLVGEELDPFAAADEVERKTWVREALRELPQHLADAVHLVYYQGLKYREAAEALGIPVGTVKSRMNAAITKLHESWQAAHE